MTVDELLERAQVFHATLTLSEPGRLHVTAPEPLPEDFVAELREHKPEIVARLRQLGDGQPPPLDRPPVTQQELRRLIDHLADPAAFTAWLDWAMRYTDPVERHATYEVTRNNNDGEEELNRA